METRLCATEVLLKTIRHSLRSVSTFLNSEYIYSVLVFCYSLVLLSFVTGGVGWWGVSLM